MDKWMATTEALGKIFNLNCDVAYEAVQQTLAGNFSK